MSTPDPNPPGRGVDDVVRQRAGGTNVLWRMVQGRIDLEGGRFVAVLVVPVFVVYLFTASWVMAASPDTFLNTLTAHAITNEGTVFLDDSYEVLRDRPFGQWIEEADGRLVSQYPPGAALHAVPLYALAGDGNVLEVTETGAEPGAIGATTQVLIPEVWPAALTSALVATLAVVFLGLALRELAPAHQALAGAYVAAFATSAWTVAADELWQHGAAMMWVAVGSWGLARARWGASAVASFATIVVRPLTAAIVVVPALWVARRRRWAVAAVLLAGIGLGVAAVIGYNAAVFGEPSLQGGYGSERSDQLLTRSPLWYPANYAKGLFAPRYGLLVWSPWLALLLPGARRAWRVAPDWVRSSAAGGAVYLALQWSLNRASGGSLYLFYRYPLEPLMAAAPLLFLAYREGIAGRRKWLVGFWVLVAFSVVAHAVVSPR